MFRYINSGLCLACLFLCSCQKEDQTTASLSQEKVQIKPTVAIVPVIDNSRHTMTWSLSDELTNAICFKLDQKDRLKVEDVQKVKSTTRKFQASHNPFGDELRWVKRAFPQDDFVVFLELLEHAEVPSRTDNVVPAKDCSANLNISLRVRVLDMRGTEPEVVLQEIVHDTHFIPRQFNQYNFHQAAWGTEEFNISPVGIAHAQFIKEVSSRIEDYVLLAKGS